ncbi:hypothetical protein NC981_09630 [Leptolyngbya sp. DQ-M1]|uniref:hypothetical protein n=1 Tax=Leptolyngbya sp. DQ-M1 TaxID=2933920 RepID=UPI003298DD76
MSVPIVTGCDHHLFRDRLHQRSSHHPHIFFEAIAYTVALRLSLQNFRRDTIKPTQRSSIVVAGVVGALIGAKVLVMLQHIDLWWQQRGLF